VVPSDATFQRFLRAADDGQLTQNPEQVAIDVIAKILSADTIEGVFGGAGTIHARDYLDTPFKLLGLHFNESTYDSAGPNFYALLEGVSVDGETLAITCGAKNVIAQAWKLGDMNALPMNVVIKQSAKATASGFYIMWLEQAPDPF
jgi:hypothetical protein